MLLSIWNMRALAHTIELELRPLFCPNLAASSVCRGKWIFKESYLVCRYLLMPTSSTEVKALETTYCKLIYKRLSRWQRTGKKARREAPTWPLANWSIGQLRVLINSPNVPWVMCVLCVGKLQHHRTRNKNRNRTSSWGRQNVAQSNCANRRTKPVNKLVLNGQYGQLPYIE